jgi:hypothetical protein
MRCHRCDYPLEGGEPRAFGGVEARWYRCIGCRISYAVPTDQGPVVSVREFAPDIVVLGWLGLHLWLWRLWRSRWFSRGG